MRFLLVLLLLFTSNQFLSAQTLHGILVGATNDPSIGKGCQGDIDRMQRRLQHIARGINHRLSMTVLTDTAFRADHLLNTLQQLSCDSTDIVFLYYSGHGFQPHQKAIYPGLQFEKVPSTNDPALETIYRHYSASGLIS